MNENVKKVMLGFLNLTESEKAEFIRQLNMRQTKSLSEQRSWDSDVKRLGPTNQNACPCCGK